MSGCSQYLPHFTELDKQIIWDNTMHSPQKCSYWLVLQGEEITCHFGMMSLVWSTHKPVPEDSKWLLHNTPRNTPKTVFWQCVEFMGNPRLVLQLLPAFAFSPHNTYLMWERKRRLKWKLHQFSEENHTCLSTWGSDYNFNWRLCCFVYYILFSLPSRADNWLVDTGSDPVQHDGLSEFGKVRHT